MMNPPFRLFQCATLLLLSLHASAAEQCPMVSRADVAATFNDPDVRLDVADPGGMCHWSLSNGAGLSISTQKRPSVAEAAQLYDHFKSTGMQKLVRRVKTLPLGQRAYVGMTRADDPDGAAELVALKADTLLVINYSLGASDTIDDTVSTQLQSLAALALPGKAVQSFDKCEWIAEKDAQALLGPGQLSIHRYGPKHCLVSILKTGAAVTERTDQASVEPGVRLRAYEGEQCTVIPLPEFGKDAHASFACPAPGDRAMEIQFIKKGTLGVIDFSPAGRLATKADLKAMKVIGQYVFDRLSR